MASLLLLIKTSLRNQYGLARFKSGRKPWLKLVLAVLVIALGMVGLFGGVFQYSWIMGGVLQRFGMLHLLLLQAILFASLVCFFTGIYTVPGQLFFCSDYDLLLSLPLRTSIVLMSKMAGVLFSQWVIAALLALPLLLVYGMKSGAGPLFYLFAAAALPFIPLVPLSLAALCALFTGKVAARFKRSNKIITYLTLVLLVGFVAGYANLSHSDRAVMAGLDGILRAIKTWYPPARFCFDALNGPSLFSLLLFIGLSAGLFILFCAFFARFFKAIQSSLSATSARANYQLRALSSSSVLEALYWKELRGYLSCPVYIMNTFFGMVMLTVFSVSMLCLSNTMKARLFQQPGLGEAAPMMCLMLVATCAAISYTTAATISLEGRSLWILKTAPVSPLLIFQSKLLLNLCTTWPLIALNAALLTIGLRLDFCHSLLVWGVPSVYALFMALVGLLINLLYPKLEFKNPVVVVKQSASALLTFLASFASLALPIALYAWLRPARLSYELYATLVAAVLLILAALLWQALKTVGVRCFARLH